MSDNYSFFGAVERSFDKAAKFTRWDLGILQQIKAEIDDGRNRCRPYKQTRGERRPRREEGTNPVGLSQPVV